jgi:DNA-directed RNA polymerase specialized sigma24 family protein
MRKSRFSHETLSKIVEDYNADILSNIEIEQKYGMGQNTLRKLLRKLNVPMKLGRISEEQTSQIIKSYLDGKSSEQIAIEVGFDSTSILRILKRNNTETRRRRTKRTNINIHLYI